jgi:hypothetical protein
LYNRTGKAQFQIGEDMGRQVTSKQGTVSTINVAQIQSRFALLSTSSLTIHVLPSYVQDQTAISYSGSTNGTTKIPQIQAVGFTQEQVDLIDTFVVALRTSAVNSGNQSFYSIINQMADDGWTVSIINGNVGAVKKADAGGLTKRDVNQKSLVIAIEQGDLDFSNSVDRLEYLQRFAHELLHVAISHQSTINGRPGDLVDVSVGIPANPQRVTDAEARNAETYKFTKEFIDNALSLLGATPSDSKMVMDNIVPGIKNEFTFRRRAAYAVEFKKIVAGKSSQILTTTQLIALGCVDKFTHPQSY